MTSARLHNIINTRLAMRNRLAEEMNAVEMMIRLYCHRKEGNATLCPSCSELLAYAHKRLEHCRFGSTKHTCRKCPVHCYNPVMRERIRTIMRWAGPRMLLYHPIVAVRHMVNEAKPSKQPQAARLRRAP